MPVSNQITGTFKLKAIQRGEIVLSASTALNIDATISSVNTAKSKIKLLGVRSSSSPSLSNMFTLSLVNATTIRVTRLDAAAVTATIAWEVEELE